MPAAKCGEPAGSIMVALDWSTTVALRPLHAFIVEPSWLFLFTLCAMLFRPPDIKALPIDRIGFGLLMFVMGARALLLRQSWTLWDRVSLPMLAMALLAFSEVIVQQTYDAEAWSLFAAKWLIPLALYHFAGQAFASERELRRLEIFALIVLSYLCFIAIAFLLDARAFIFPSFILDESFGYHADRARGPFLQAVANGVMLNILGLIALDSYRRGRLRGLWAVAILIALPIAILATKTRAVWLAFVICICVFLIKSGEPKVRRVCLVLTCVGSFCLLAAWGVGQYNTSFSERLEEQSPVEFRRVIYEAGWHMFLEKPLAGWGAPAMREELGRRISAFHQESFYFHNTFLEIVVQFGLAGLLPYLLVIHGLLRLHRVPVGSSAPTNTIFQDVPFRQLWPVLLGVYVLNGCFVVMNYQFVNGILFTFAGLLKQKEITFQPNES